MSRIRNTDIIVPAAAEDGVPDILLSPATGSLVRGRLSGALQHPTAELARKCPRNKQCDELTSTKIV